MKKFFRANVFYPLLPASIFQKNIAVFYTFGLKTVYTGK